MWSLKPCGGAERHVKGWKWRKKSSDLSGEIEVEGRRRNYRERWRGGTRTWRKESEILI